MANVAFLLVEGYEDLKMDLPYQKIKKAGHHAVIISLKKGELLRGKQGKSYYISEMAIAEANPIDFDAVVIPEGPEREILSSNEHVTYFVQKMHENGKLVVGIDEEIVLNGNLITSRSSEDESACIDQILAELA